MQKICHEKNNTAPHRCSSACTGACTAGCTSTCKHPCKCKPGQCTGLCRCTPAVGLGTHFQTEDDFETEGPKLDKFYAGLHAVAKSASKVGGAVAHAGGVVAHAAKVRIHEATKPKDGTNLDEIGQQDTTTDGTGQTGTDSEEEDETKPKIRKVSETELQQLQQEMMRVAAIDDARMNEFLVQIPGTRRRAIQRSGMQIRDRYAK